VPLILPVWSSKERKIAKIFLFLTYLVRCKLSPFSP